MSYEIFPDVPEVAMPPGTFAVVYIAHGEHGEILANYAESSERTPAPREQIGRALFELAIALFEQAEALDETAAS